MKPIIDVSYYQNPALIDYDKLCMAISGAIVRVAYGSGAPKKWEGVDIHWERHYYEFSKRDKPLGGYQYLTEYQPVEQQVEVMRKGIEGKKLRMGRWADVEVENGAPTLTRQTVHSYMQLAEAAMGEFGIYTSYWYWYQIMNGYYYTNKKLWVANYGVVTPRLPTGWDTYLLWQNHDTNTGRIDGYTQGGVDLNQFNGTEQQFTEWVNSESAPVEPAPKLELFSPVPTGSWISQKFGVNSTWYASSRGHNGVDYGIVKGTPITAAMDGVVEVSKEQVGGYGRHIRIRHSHGITIYGHLTKRLVEVGDKVTAKQVIGLSGGGLDDPYAGNSTGPHLHFEYRPFEPVTPLVPGSYIYNAIDTLPFTIDWERELGSMLFQVETLVSALNVRRGIGTGYAVIRTVPSGTVFNVYEEANGWYRVGEGEWISGSPTYSKKLTATPPTDNRLDKLWAAHPELH